MLKRILKTVATATMIVAMMCLLSGCKLFSLSDFKLEGAKIIDFKLGEGARVEMTITNELPFKVTVVGGELTAHYKGSTLGDIYIKRPVILTRKSTTTVTVDIGMRFSSPMAALTALKALTTSPDEITISGYGEGKVWWFTKRFERRDVPLSRFIDIFGSPSNYF